MDIYTDGACSGNPGPGGWGAVLRYGTREKEIYGSEPTETTNNRMELMAPTRALESLTRPMVVRLHTDSTYVRDGITKWLPRWKSNGWQTSSKQPVKSVDLWQRLDAAASRHQVQWHWVKGHAAPAARRATTRRVSPAADEATGSGQRCRMTTRTGQPCPIAARPSGLCHVHDPAVQCGAVKKNGQRCTNATGGGPCAAHQAAGDGDPGLF